MRVCAPAHCPAVARVADDADRLMMSLHAKPLRSRDTISVRVLLFEVATPKGGRREDRVPIAPAVRVQQESTRQNHRYEPNNRPSLRNGFTAYTRSPRCTLLFGHRRPQIIACELGISVGMPGPHDFAVLPELFVRSRTCALQLR